VTIADIDILIYAFDRTSPSHGRARRWIVDT
jgi:predicted nucleic acid-binding protein